MINFKKYRLNDRFTRPIISVSIIWALLFIVGTYTPRLDVLAMLGISMTKVYFGLFNLTLALIILLAYTVYSILTEKM